ncbi:MAG: AAA family ATPase, partial [Acidobacteria bacterium]|nr:AAA family ATPase [Acidobacteriota bacterium]
MKINKIRLRGFTVYKEQAELDLAALGPGIIAVAGPNGGGKTTLLESIPGALYRQCPSRGSIAGLATSRDAQIEIEGENGTPFVIRLDADSKDGKQEAVLIDGDGNPEAGPKVREFDLAVAKRFPGLDIYLASFFASQTGVGSVLKMSRSDRRSLFGRLLGLERLESMAVASREKARAAESEMTAARAALEAIRSGAEDVATLEEQFRAAKDKEAKAAAEARQSAEKLKAATAERDRLVEEARENERAGLIARDARKRANDAEVNLARFEAQVKALEPLLAQASGIRGNAAKIKDLAAEMDRVRADGEIASAKRDQAVSEANKKGRAVESAMFASREATRVRSDAETRAKEANDRLRAAERSTAAVPCAGVLEDGARGACPALVGHFKTRDESKRMIAAFSARTDQLDADVEYAAKALMLAEEGSAEALGVVNRAGIEVTTLREKYQQIRERADKLKTNDRTAQLDRAEAEKAGIQVALDAAKKAAAETSAEADRLWIALPKGPLPSAILEARASVESAGMEYEAALQDAQEADGQAVRIDEQLRRAREAHAKAEVLAAKLAPMEAELADWRWLGRGLGREGVQALELDAAGPQVSGLANELLADAYGSRFQLRFETQAAKADGKGVKETFDVVVVDTEKGREGNGEDLSGGEKVIVGEALGLAVGLFHAQAAGVSLGTVIRDETVGALDPENGEKYLAMLRAFLRVGHVHQLLYVAHNPALIDMADAVVR